MGRKKKEPVKIIEIEVPKNEDEERLTNIRHYENQMKEVRRVLNLKEKGFNINEIASRCGFSREYVNMVCFNGEEYMDKFWRTLHHVEDYVKTSDVK